MIVAQVTVAGLPPSSTTSPMTDVAPVVPAAVDAGQSVPTGYVRVFAVPAEAVLTPAMGIVALRRVSVNPQACISAENGGIGVCGVPDPRKAPRAVSTGLKAPAIVSPASRLPPNSFNCTVSGLSASETPVRARTSPVAQPPGSWPSVVSSLTWIELRRALSAIGFPSFRQGLEDPRRL